MALASDRKIIILMAGIFLIGLVGGMFVMRMQQDADRKSGLTFTTQSVTDEDTSPTQQILCPRAEELLAGELITYATPLVERANELFSLRSSSLSTNYIQWGPPGRTIGDRKAQLVEHSLDSVTAGLFDGNAQCIYSSLGNDVAILRQDNIGTDCTALNTELIVGFSCPIEAK